MRGARRAAAVRSRAVAHGGGHGDRAADRAGQRPHPVDRRSPVRGGPGAGRPRRHARVLPRALDGAAHDRLAHGRDERRLRRRRRHRLPARAILHAGAHGDRARRRGGRARDLRAGRRPSRGDRMGRDRCGHAGRLHRHPGRLHRPDRADVVGGGLPADRTRRAVVGGAVPERAARTPPRVPRVRDPSSADRDRSGSPPSPRRSTSDPSRSSPWCRHSSRPSRWCSARSCCTNACTCTSGSASR